jgi:hypothetical protein
VKLPNADKAVIAEDKLRTYLLNVEHRRGGSKATLLIAMGYSPDEWRRLEADLRKQHLTADCRSDEKTIYGQSYVIVAPLTGPGGRGVNFRSVWQIDTGTDLPRLVTMYPE